MFKTTKVAKVNNIKIVVSNYSKIYEINNITFKGEQLYISNLGTCGIYNNWTVFVLKYSDFTECYHDRVIVISEYKMNEFQAKKDCLEELERLLDIGGVR